MHTPTQYDIELTQRYDHLPHESETGVVCFRFYCDECSDPVEVDKVELENPSEEQLQDWLAEVESVARQWLQFCPYCVKWVCVTCWHALNGLCEVCNKIPSEERVLKQLKPKAMNRHDENEEDNEEQDFMFSSILGSLCGHCGEPLHPGDVHCQTCGHAMHESIPTVVYDAAED